MMKIGWDKIISWVVIFVLGFAAGAGFITIRNQSRPLPIEIIAPGPTATPLPTPTAAPIRVYMSGQVARPGVYTLPPDSIVEQGISAAGGFSSAADAAAVNLAQPLHDGVQVYVPAIDEVQVGQSPTAPNRSGGGITVGVGGIGGSEEEQTGQGLVNINTAGTAELETLPGIGPVTAQDIVDYRAANGPFASIEAIMDVPGIGEGKFAQIQSLITIGP
jgi:competence protein ComEA